MESDRPKRGAVLPARADIALLTLRLRSALHEAEQAEAAEAVHTSVEIERAREALRARLQPMLEQRRERLDAAMDVARAEAAATIVAARQDAAAIAAQAAQAASVAQVALVGPVVQVALQPQPAEQPPVLESAADSGSVVPGEPAIERVPAARGSGWWSRFPAPPAPPAMTVVVPEPVVPEPVVPEPVVAASPALDADQVRWASTEPDSPVDIAPVDPAPVTIFRPLVSNREKIWPTTPRSTTSPFNRTRVRPDIAPVDIVPVDLVPVDIAPVDLAPVDLAPVGFMPPHPDDIWRAAVPVADPRIPAVIATASMPAQVVIDSEAFARVFATVVASLLEERMGSASHPPAAWPTYIPVPIQVPMQVPIQAQVQRPANSSQGMWSAARHPDVLLLGITGLIVLGILAAWLV